MTLPPFMCYRWGMFRPILLAIALTLACGDDSEPSIAPHSQGLGGICQFDPFPESDSCKDGLKCASNSSCALGMCYELGCRDASDCPSVEGKVANCGVVTGKPDDSVCGWECFVDRDCPQTFEAPMTCSCANVPSGEPCDCIVNESICGETS